MRWVLGVVAVLVVAFLAFGAWKDSGRTPEQREQLEAVRLCREQARARIEAGAQCEQMALDYLNRWGEAP